MTAWKALDRSDEDLIWGRFETRFEFRASTHSDQWPAIREPTPSVTYSLTGAAEGVEDRQTFLARASEVNCAMLTAFRCCTHEDEALYVLDWQHPGYAFHPHAAFNPRIWSEWETPVFPDGDYYIFLEQEFRFGTFGHPWEQTLCVFGAELLQAFDATAVGWLGPVIRQNGTAV